jgi:acetyl esterase/lipase
MPNTRRFFLSAVACLYFWSTGSCLAQVRQLHLPTDELIAPGASEVIPLWPGLPPGTASSTLDLNVAQIVNMRQNQDPAINMITRPVISVYRAAKPDGSAVLFIPGGGYAHIAGGPGVARWLAARGTTVFMLLYRLPQDGWEAGADTPLQDAQRAMRLIRASAAQWKLDPARIGVMGASAGGHVAGQLITRFDATTYTPVDARDTLSARPDFACLNYAVVTMQGELAHGGSRKRLLGANPTARQLAQYSNELLVRADMPPTFLIHAADDASVPVDNTLMLFAAIRRVKVDTAMHIFEKGGHGFGLGSRVGPTVQVWPDLFVKWAASHKMLLEAY